MNFCFTEEQEALRQEVRDFLKKEVPPDKTWVEWDEIYGDDEMWRISRETARKFGEKGWLAFSWPKEYGGSGRSHVDACILGYEIAYHRATGIDMQGTKMLGPSIIFFGTEEQKKQHLGPIARGEIVWCEGYSEPEAGSDLSSLKTRAVEQGDHYVINGQKVWTSGAHRADWMFLLARTDPDVKKSKGLTLFLIDMKTPGIEVRPLQSILGQNGFNEVFLEDVKVPKENILGEVNQGWLVGNAVLSFERSMVELVATTQRYLDDLVEFAINDPIGRRLLAQNPSLRHKFAEMRIGTEVARLLNYRIAWMQDAGLSPDMEAAMSKVFISELLQTLMDAGMDLLGLYGPLRRHSPRVCLRGMIPGEATGVLGIKIAAGTSEIMRTIIATRGLGLPR